MFNNIEYDESPLFDKIDRLIVNPLSLQSSMIEESIVYKESVILEFSYFENRYSEFKSLDAGLKSDLFTFVQTYNDYLVAAFTSTIRLTIF